MQKISQRMSLLFNKRSLRRAASVSAPVVLMLACSAIAKCSTIDFSTDIRQMASDAFTLGMFVGAIIGALILIFGIMKLAGRDWVSGVTAFFGGLAVLGIIGHVTGWTTSLTGISGL